MSGLKFINKCKWKYTLSRISSGPQPQGARFFNGGPRPLFPLEPPAPGNLIVRQYAFQQKFSQWRMGALTGWCIVGAKLWLSCRLWLTGRNEAHSEIIVRKLNAKSPENFNCKKTIWRRCYLAAGNFLVNAHMFRRVERRMPGSHLVDENTRRPPVYGVIVALSRRTQFTWVLI